MAPGTGDLLTVNDLTVAYAGLMLLRYGTSHFKSATVNESGWWANLVLGRPR